MPFNSFTYLLFLPAVAGVYAWLRARALQPIAQAWLLFVSLFFYAYAKPSNLPLLLLSIGFNWAIARAMMKQDGDAKRKLILRAGLLINVAFLCLFKYINFFIRTLGYLHGPQLQFPNWDFPLGISFFTLTQVMYLVDTYQGLNAANSLFDHATFVSLYPYVTSGPLVRARSVVPQLRTVLSSEGRLELACRGVYLFGIGLAKKVVLADSFAAVANAGFGSMRNFSALEAWAFAFAFLFQIYFDFSGYSDMAVASAWMLGIDIPQNFNAPLRARSISEFWQRWHISLSNFITNYLYTPILRAMPKPTLSASVVATVAAMTICGLWHGPAWTFVMWGLSHGVALAINQIWRRRKLQMPDWLGVVLTQLFVVASLVFFRSPDMPFALHLLSRLIPRAHPFGHSALNDVLPFSPATLLNPVVIGVIVAFAFKSSMDLANDFKPSLKTAFAAAGLVLISMIFMNSSPAKTFIYFAF